MFFQALVGFFLFLDESMATWRPKQAGCGSIGTPLLSLLTETASWFWTGSCVISKPLASTMNTKWGHPWLRKHQIYGLWDGQSGCSCIPWTGWNHWLRIEDEPVLIDPSCFFHNILLISEHSPWLFWVFGNRHVDIIAGYCIGFPGVISVYGLMFDLHGCCCSYLR